MRIAAVAIVVVLCAAVVRRGAPEMSLVLVLSAGVVIFCLVLGALEEILSAMKRLAQLAQLEDELIAPVAKTVVVAIITRLIGEICRSAGEGGVAAFVEVAGTIVALMVALPLMEAVIQMMTEILL